MKPPLDCTADYYQDFLSKEEAEDLFNTLVQDYEIDKARTVIEVNGKYYQTDGFRILFLSEELIGRDSHPEHIQGKRYVFKGKMAELKSKVENLLDRKFDLAMYLYYPNGHYFAPYHSDQETSGFNTILPSISLGEQREFSLKTNRMKKFTS